MIVLVHARLLTMDGRGIIEDGFIAADNGVILEVGPTEMLPTGKEWESKKWSESDVVVDAGGGWVLPGFIDAHSHIGLFDDSLDLEGSDGNELTDPITPYLRAIDGIHNADVCFREAYEAGVSVVMTGPGSGNVMGGQFALLRTYERTVDRAVIAEPGAQKAAFGENPKRVYGQDKKSPSTRMGIAGLLRDTLFATLEYAEKLDIYRTKMTEYEEAKASGDEDAPERPDKPDFDFEAESLLSVVTGRLPLKIHAHRQDDILTAVRICNEFGVTYTLEHCTEGHLIADVLYDEYVAGLEPGRGTGNREAKGGRLLGIVVGPIIGDRSKPELSHLMPETAERLRRTGLPVAIMTDHPCVPEQYLATSAALAVKAGMPYEAALRAITSTAAEILGISDCFGSLTVGKTADFTLFTGDPFDYRSRVRLFVGGGAVRYDPESLCSGAKERV